ncbi:MAG TPA: glycine cleavage system protein GcvH [Nitrospinota bacterium]|nr:glycine cleavage system protein GcvH [Nitrospinota bacterium]
MEFPKDLKYSKEHEWTRIEGGKAIIGITDHAQEELGDVVFVELPEVGSEVEQMGTFGVVESVKAVSDLYSPVTGEVLEINEALKEEPELINSDPYGDGWLIVVKISDEDEIDALLSAEEYEAFIKEEKK